MKFVHEADLEEVTPEFLAEQFCELPSDGQAVFFNHISTITAGWDKGGFEMQLQYVTDDRALTQGGRDVMGLIGLYSSPSSKFE